jgi:hypothetical protein
VSTPPSDHIMMSGEQFSKLVRLLNEEMFVYFEHLLLNLFALSGREILGGPVGTALEQQEPVYVVSNSPLRKRG